MKARLVSEALEAERRVGRRLESQRALLVWRGALDEAKEHPDISPMGRMARLPCHQQQGTQGNIEFFSETSTEVALGS